MSDIDMLQVWSLGYAARLGVRLGGFSYRLFVFAVNGIRHRVGRVDVDMFRASSGFWWSGSLTGVLRFW